MVEGEPRRLGIFGVEASVRLLGDVELGPEDEAEALETPEPGAELVLRQVLGVGGPLELREREELPLDETGADEAGVLLVRLVVGGVRGREESVERRLTGVERVAELPRQRRKDVPLLRRQVDAVGAVATSPDPAGHSPSPVASSPTGRARGAARRRAPPSLWSRTRRRPCRRCGPGASAGSPSRASTRTTAGARA